MPTIEELRQRQCDHSRRLESVFFAKPNELAARWNIDVETVTAIPRADLPYLTFGKSKSRRYDPRDVEAYEERAKNDA